jgi:hypothetical protein
MQHVTTRWHHVPIRRIRPWQGNGRTLSRRSVNGTVAEHDTLSVVGARTLLACLSRFGSNHRGCSDCWTRQCDDWKATVAAAAFPDRVSIDRIADGPSWELAQIICPSQRPTDRPTDRPRLCRSRAGYSERRMSDGK